MRLRLPRLRRGGRMPAYQPGGGDSVVARLSPGRSASDNNGVLTCRDCGESSDGPVPRAKAMDWLIAHRCEPPDPDRAPAEPLPADVVQRQGEHRYLSTACWHGLHPRCRDTCKFCGVACRCACHEEET